MSFRHMAIHPGEGSRREVVVLSTCYALQPADAPESPAVVSVVA